MSREELKPLLEEVKKLLTEVKQLLEEIKATKMPEVQVVKELEGLKVKVDVGRLLRLPDHLRQTFIALAKVGEGTAEDVSNITGRARAIESAYLNQLTHLGYAVKKRKGKKVYFTVKP